MSTTISVRLAVNGESHELQVEPRLLLVHFLRDELGLTGTHVGCDTSQLRRLHRASRRRVGEELHRARRAGRRRRGHDDRGHRRRRATLHPLQEAFWEQHGLQCGYCTPGMIMAAADLLARNPNPSEEEIRKGLEGNLCRCTGYHNIVKAVQSAAKPRCRIHAAAHGRGGAGRWRHGDGTADGPERPYVGQAIRRRGGPAPDHRPRELRRRHHPARACSTRPSCARPRRTRASPRSTPARPPRATRACAAVFTGEDLADLGVAAARWSGRRPAWRSRRPTAGRWRADRCCHVGEPVAVVVADDKYAVVDAAEDVVGRLRPAPGGGRSRRRRSRTAPP